MRRIRTWAAGVALVALIATGCGWQFEVVDGAGGGGGRTTADVGSDVAMVGSHAFYYDADNGNLRHAYYTVAGWQHEVLDGAGGSNGRIDADVGSGVTGMLDDTRFARLLLRRHERQPASGLLRGWRLALRDDRR